jgi:hypothetical protein
MPDYRAPFSQTPVAFLQWGPLHEPDEAYDAATTLRLKLKEDAGELRAPHITKLRVTEPNPESALEALRWLLSTHRCLQVLYVTAHGLRGGRLCFDSDGTDSFDYAAFGRALAHGLSGLANRVVLVMGACFSLDHEQQLEAALPDEVLEVVGFTTTPSSADVSALIAAVLKSDEELLQKVTKAAADAANNGNDVAAAAEAAHDGHESRLSRYVTGRGGKEIRHLQRSDCGYWTGTTLAL